LRLSQEAVTEPRWDEKFVLKEMKKYFPTDINRVWVCGPPLMNETFSKAFDTVAFKNFGWKRD
jgi:NAD(P)H-flavin reductase